MGRYTLAAAAVSDLAEISAASMEQFGDRAAERYETLIAAALADVAADPERAGSRAADELGPGARLYHLRHSRAGVGAERRVGSPRHFILYRRISADVIGVARLLFDAMDLPSHATDDYGGDQG